MMVNISQANRWSGELTIWQWLRSMRGPDVYEADNIRDIKKNAPNLEYPQWKSFHSDVTAHRAAISVSNVNIELLEDGDTGRWFKVYDETEAMTMVWADGERTYYEPIISFEQATCEQGLNRNDRVSELFILYLINDRIPIIIDVEKTDSQSGWKRRKKVADQLKSGLTIPNLVPNPGI